MVELNTITVTNKVLLQSNKYNCLIALKLDHMKLENYVIVVLMIEKNYLSFFF